MRVAQVSDRDAEALTLAVAVAIAAYLADEPG